MALGPEVTTTTGAVASKTVWSPRTKGHRADCSARLRRTNCVMPLSKLGALVKGAEIMSEGLG
jgi:hypothetical protein